MVAHFITNLVVVVYDIIVSDAYFMDFPILTADKMEKVQEKISKGDQGLIKVISVAAMLGSFGASVSGHLVAMNKNTIAALAGGLSC